jgi:ABC-type transport system involved in cytochrome bd biosynthesis fused ATPase/permease subunit
MHPVVRQIIGGATKHSAADLFKAVPSIRDKLETLKRVGLGYIHVGQQATTLSGGEAQRIKLARELGKRGVGHTLYLFDEPTSGLHVGDVRRLLEVLTRLVDGGHTVVVIEHHVDVMKVADYIIDMGADVRYDTRVDSLKSLLDDKQLARFPVVERMLSQFRNLKGESIVASTSKGWTSSYQNAPLSS